MRFKSLLLKAFGPFEQKELDLSNPGLQIIVGDNGAGKSTTMRALRGLLFGIPEANDGWLPQSKGRMEIGGHLTHGEEELELFRRRTKNFSAEIYDSEGTKLDPALLTPFTGSMSTSAFSALFVIDALEIEDGGKALLSGDAGAALMAATSGTNAIPSVIEALEQDAEAIFKPKSSKLKINEIIKELKELRAESRASLIRASDWKARLREQKEAESAFEAVKSELEDIETRRNRAQRIRGVVRSVGALRQFNLDLEEVKGAPLLGEDAVERRNAAQKTKGEAEAAIKSANSKIDVTRAELAAAAFDERLVELEPLLEELNDRRAVTHKAVIEDLPTRNSNYDEASGRALASLRKVHPTETDISKIDGFIPTTAQKTQIQTLITAHNRITTLRETCSDDLEMESNAVAELETAVKAETATPDTKRLAATLSSIRKEGRLEDDLRNAEATYKSSKKKTGRLAAALSHVGDDPKDIVVVPLPGDEEVRFHEDVLATADENVREAKRAAEQASRRIAGLKADLAEIEATSDVPTLADRDSARKARESTWARIRSIWVGGESMEEPETPDSLAETLEATTSKADSVADRITQDAEQFALKQSLRAAIDKATSAEEEALASLESVEETLSSAGNDWGSIWEPTKITPASPSAMREWITNHAALVTAWDESVAAEIEVARLQDVISGHKESLGEALAGTKLPAVGTKETLDQALTRAEASLDELRSGAEDQRQAAGDLKSAKARLVGAKDALAAATKELADWQAEWAMPLRAISLDPSLTPDAVQAVLHDLGEADKAREKAAEAEDRKTKILQDRDDLQSYVNRHAATAGIEKELGDDPIEAASKLAARITEALDSSKQAGHLTSSLSEVEEALRDATLKLETADVELGSLMKAAKVQSADDLPEAERRSSTRANLEAEIKRSAAEILDGRQKPLEELIAEAEGANADSLDAEVGQLNREFKDTERQRDVVHERLIEARRATAASDKTSIAAEAAATTRSVAAEGAALVEDYARLKIAEVVLSRAVKANLEASQGPILHRAGELFAELTDKKFNGLIVDWDGQEPTLLATESDSEIPGELLSDGERDSLYLALRLAAIEQNSTQGNPMPLLLDDILVNLDDERTSAALKALARVAESTQVLLFSHHPHVAELAKRNLPRAAFSTLDLAH